MVSLGTGHRSTAGVNDISLMTPAARRSDFQALLSGIELMPNANGVSHIHSMPECLGSKNYHSGLPHRGTTAAGRAATPVSQTLTGTRLLIPRSCSNLEAAASSSASPLGFPTICRPKGKLDFVNPHGRDRIGKAVKVKT